MGKFDLKACGLSLGIVWAAAVLLTGITSAIFNWGTPFVDLFGSFYPGYNATFIGSLIGGIWGFLDGAFCGLLLGWLYNKFAK